MVYSFSNATTEVGNFYLSQSVVAKLSIFKSNQTFTNPQSIGTEINFCSVYVVTKNGLLVMVLERI